jgi:hypothetical protein
MSLPEEIKFVLRRIPTEDLKILLGQTMYDTVPCYYRTRYGDEHGFTIFYQTVRDEITDIIFYRMTNNQLLDYNESTEEQEIQLINKGLTKMFSETIKDYYDNVDCTKYGKDESSSINEGKFDEKDAFSFLFRRITKGDLEDSFYENYKYFNESNIGSDTSFFAFKERFIYYMMDDLRSLLDDGYWQDSDMYTAVEELLELMYKDQIEDLWDELNDNEY